MPDAVLHLRFIEYDHRLGADTEHMLAEPQRDEVAASDRPHQEQFERQRHLHQPGVGERMLRRSPSSNIDVSQASASARKEGDSDSHLVV